MTALDWAAFAAEASQLTRADQLRRLTTVALSGSPVVYSGFNRDAGLPASRPPNRLVRAAGMDLAQAEDAVQEVRAIGLASRFWRAQATEAVDSQNWASLAEARDTAQRAGNTFLEAWVEMMTADQLARTGRASLGLEHADRAQELVESDILVGTGPFAFAESRWAESGDAARAHVIMRYYAWSTVRLTRRYTGDLEGWRRAAAECRVISAVVRQERPSLFIAALQAQAVLERRLGHTADLTELKAGRRESRLYEQAYLAQAADNAVALGDHIGASALQSERVAVILAGRHPELVGVAPAELVPRLKNLSEAARQSLDTVAKGAYEISLHLFRSGRAVLDRKERQRALDWLDVAGALWEGWSINGPLALMTRRATIEIDRRPDAALDLIRVARDSTSPGLKANAICTAAKDGHHHLDAVLNQVRTMLRASWDPRDRAMIESSYAWLSVAADPGESLASAKKVLDLLPGYPAGALRSIAMAEDVRARAAAALGYAAEERNAHFEGVKILARMLLNATTADQRLILAGEWAPTIRRALRFASENQDTELADLVHEVVRRDAAGSMLARVDGNSGAPEVAVEAAQRATMAGRADALDVVEEINGAEPRDPSQDSQDDFPEERVRSASAAVIEGRNREAYEMAEQTLGHLGSMIDPMTLLSARAHNVITAVSRDRPTYLLQLMPSSIPLVGDDGRATIHRHLTWSMPAGTGEYIDSVALPSGLLLETENGILTTWVDPVPLFPAPLIDGLRAATSASPIRILIVPTGLFHVQFDALKFGDDYLIEKAVTSVHTSLTAAMHSLRTKSMWAADAGSYGVLDEEALPATARERAALQRHFPDLLQPRGKEMLAAALRTAPNALFALSVHGIDDSGGWAQKKLLPGGDELTAAETLQYRFPDICVLASCHSRVRSTGVDLAGFPTAMFARGAKTIIGSIGELFDVATSEILEHFYERLRETQDPVMSLRDARLAWIDEDPDVRWDAPERWARLVVYGGAEY